SVRHIFKPISYLEIQLLSGVSGGYIRLTWTIKIALHILVRRVRDIVLIICIKNNIVVRPSEEGDPNF
ncbi:hypothetical protein K5C76_26690, partial [Klebsiella pneumoniae]|uniref:hypothetical protein n=1 Tax=Klebsiella pneumoniae TaxID=573 RepID=UPI001C60D253